MRLKSHTRCSGQVAACACCLMTVASCWQFWRCISEETAVQSDWIRLQILDWGCSNQKVPLHWTITAVISPGLRCAHLVITAVLLQDVTVAQDIE